jgi:hypothetical protein
MHFPQSPCDPSSSQVAAIAAHTAAYALASASSTQNCPHVSASASSFILSNTSKPAHLPIKTINITFANPRRRAQQNTQHTSFFSLPIPFRVRIKIAGTDFEFRNALSHSRCHQSDRVLWVCRAKHVAPRRWGRTRCAPNRLPLPRFPEVYGIGWCEIAPAHSHSLTTHQSSTSVSNGYLLIVSVLRSVTMPKAAKGRSGKAEKKGRAKKGKWCLPGSKCSKVHKD